MSKKPKLPKVWVSFDHGVAWIEDEPREKGDVRGPTHQYAPVQKPRRCTWKPGEAHWTDTEMKFCPYCGGRIVRRKS